MATLIDILFLIYKETISNRSANKETYRTLDHLKYARESKTIKLSYGRGVGKTEASKDLLDGDDTTLVVVHNKILKREYESCKNYKHVISTDEILHYFNGKDKKFKLIVILEPHSVGPGNISFLYEKTVDPTEMFQTYILLGE